MSSNNRQIILPVAIGLSLCGLSAYFMYLYLKRKEDEDYWPKTSHNRTYELKIAKNIVPALIGRGGSNIKEIQEKSGCRINFKDDKVEEEERICVLRGDTDSIHMAELLIQNCIANLSLIEVEEMWVPQTACGRIIGRCGENIQKMMRSSNTRIDLDSNNSREEGDVVLCRLTIKGTPEQIAVAKSLIETRITEDAEIRQNLAQRQPRGPPKISPAPSPTPPKKEDKVMVKHFNEKFSETGQVDGRIEVYVSAVEDPGKFWVQIVGPKATELDQLVDQMTEYYSKEENASLHRLNDVTVGEIVAAQFAFDKKWYRAEVTKIMRDLDSPQKEVVDLYFVDYGDTSVVSKNDVYELRTDFLRLCFQAIECFLATVEPAEGKEWSEEAIELFEGLTQVAQWKKLWSKIIRYKDRNNKPISDRSKREGSPIPGIKLYDSMKDGDVDIADELVKAGFAIYESDSKPLTSPTSVRATSEPKGFVTDPAVTSSDTNVKKPTTVDTAPKTSSEINILSSTSDDKVIDNLPSSDITITKEFRNIDDDNASSSTRATSEPKPIVTDSLTKKETNLKKPATVGSVTLKTPPENILSSPSNNNIIDNLASSNITVTGKTSNAGGGDNVISSAVHNGNVSEMQKFQELSEKNGNISDKNLDELSNITSKTNREDVKSFLDSERVLGGGDSAKRPESVNVKKQIFEKKFE